MRPRIAADQLDVQLLEGHVLDRHEGLEVPVVVDGAVLVDVVLVDVVGVDRAQPEDQRVLEVSVGDVGEAANAGAGQALLGVELPVARDAPDGSLGGVEAELDVRGQDELQRRADALRGAVRPVVGLLTGQALVFRGDLELDPTQVEDTDRTGGQR